VTMMMMRMMIIIIVFLYILWWWWWCFFVFRSFDLLCPGKILFSWIPWNHIMWSILIPRPYKASVVMVSKWGQPQESSGKIGMIWGP
jgi:hypothetical protein